MTRALLLSIGILATALAAHGQLTPEIAASIPQYGAAPGDQTMPVVATNGSEFLVAWIDARGTPAAIYANRVAADGRRLDGTGIRIPTGLPADRVQLVGLHFIDGDYTLVYTYLTFQSGVTSSHVAIAIIGADGKLIEGPRVILDDRAVGQSASNGSRIVVLTAADFVVIDSRGDVIARYPMPSPVTAIGSNGNTFLAVGFAQNGATGSEALVALNRDGKPGEVSRLDAPAYSCDPLVVSDGSDYLVVSTLAFATGNVAQNVNAHAEVKSSLNAGAYTSLVWTGAAYIGVALTAQQEIALVTIDRKGAPAGSSRILDTGTPGRFAQTAAAWNGTAALLTWLTGSHGAPFGLEIAGIIANAAATPTSSVFTIPSAANAQRNAAVAASGPEDLIAWAEPSGIFATRITAAGVPLDGRGIVVTSEDMTSSGYLTSSGFKAVRAIDDGTSYIVAWGSNRIWGDRDLLTGPVRARRISHSGALVGDIIELSPCSRTFDFVMGADAPVLFHTPCSGEGLVAQRIGPTGPAGSPVVISNMSGADFPRAAWDGSEWLVAWNNLTESGLLIYPPVFQADVYAARTSAALTLFDTQPLPIDVATGNAGPPLVATDGHDFLVVWAATHFGQSSGLYGRSVRADGSMAGEDLLVAGSLEAKSVAWTRNRYAIAFSTSTSDEDLFLTHPGAHDQAAVSATPNDERDAALIAPPGRPLRVVYTRVAPESPYGGVPRLFLRYEILPKRRSVR
jgi:hypothetical protein